LLEPDALIACAAIAVERYSASVLDNATVGFLLLHHDMTPDPKLKKYTVIDHHVPLSPS